MKKNVLDFSPSRNTIVGGILCNDPDSYEPEIVSLIKFFINQSKKHLFIDVGSNIGLFPLIASKFASTNDIPISIYAHEPLPSLRIVANKLQQVNDIIYHLSSIALSDYDGVSDFYVSARSDASNSLISGFRPSKEVIQVKVNTLDQVYYDLLKNHDYDEFLLMVDVETAEPQVLRGAERVIKNYRPKIICEVLSGRTESELQTIMSGYGYTFYRYKDESWVLEEKVFGDSSHKYRDWLFLPKEESIHLGPILKLSL